jgi:plasmid stability protein
MISQMTDILIRNVPAKTLAILKDRAKQRGRSVQVEALEALTIGTQTTGQSLVSWLKTVRDETLDSAAGIAAIREGRDTR